MFQTHEFYDQLTSHLFSPWWMYLLMGLNFLLLAVLIFFFPTLLAYLVAGFLLFNGLLLVVLAFNVKRLKKRYHQWKNKYWITVE